MPQHGQIMTMGFGSRTRKPWPMLNYDHHQCPILLYVPHEQVFMEYLDRLVVIYIWWPTWLSEDERRTVQLVREHLKTAMSRKKNCTNHHHQEVNLRVEDQVCLQATSLSREPSIFMASEAHTKIYQPLQDHFKTKSRHLSAGVTTWVTHCAQHFPHDTTPEVFPTS